MAGLAKFLVRAGEVAHVTRIVRAPLLISFLGGIVLFLPDQTREVYRILAQPSRTYGYVQVCFSIAMIILATVVPWMVARRLVSRHGEQLLRQTDLAGALSRWLPRICGSFIPLGVAVGLIIASTEMAFDLPTRLVEANPDLVQLRAETSTVEATLSWSANLCLLLAIVPLFGGLLRGDNSSSSAGHPTRWPGRRFAALLIAFILLASVAVSLAPVAIGQIMGSLAILLAFIVTLVFALGALTATCDGYRVPAISCFFLLAIVFSALGLNDNHAVPLTQRDPGRLPSARNALDAWLETRADKDFYGDKPYPVFFVTAAGGGMYAAHHAATVLARLQDRCPNFAQHVFAISSVSGGSLGSAVFAGLARHFAPNTAHQGCQFSSLGVGPLEQRVQKYFLDADLLAPVVAASLFPDFLQRFLPIRINRFDRAHALEASFTDAWPRAAPEKASENPFTRPFLDFRDAARPGPALILNATDVEYGIRVAITPFEIVSLGEIGNIESMTKIAEFHNALRGTAGAGEWDFNRDLTLGSAVGLSARFPWILPAAAVPLVARNARIVDGGYIENSGAEAVLDLLRTLRRSYHGNGGRKISVHIISISSIQLIEQSSWQGIGELLSPLRAMLNTRDSRGTLSIYRASNFADDCLADATCNKADAQFRIFPLDLVDFPIPLGWHLSPISAGLIRLHSGHAGQPYLSGDVINENRGLRVSGYIQQANDAACDIEKLLHGLRFSDSCPPP